MKPLLLLITAFRGLTFLLLAGLALQGKAQELDVNTIVTRANHVAFYQGEDGRAETRMKIVDGNGREQLRQFTILRKDVEDNGDQMFYVFFQRPSDVRRTAFLVKKHLDQDDDRWLYLPSLDLVKRISAGDKRTSFVGSDFYYEDVSGRGLQEDRHELVATTDTHYKVKNTPLNPDAVEFEYYLVWINKDTFMPEKTEYYDAQGKMYRSIESLQVEDIDGFPTTTRMKVSDHRTAGYTLSEMRFIKYNIGLPDEVFSERSLRTPPQQWLERPSR
ncbi:MAG: outer membrane lipoprotein-sorting protein [Pseudomonadota bacterium]|nr:outer membrane lipoprotein-sorting protein [Pseudomonadota bacterium]